jgi:hypothetical protein
MVNTPEKLVVPAAGAWQVFRGHPESMNIPL